jgi:hypothetical protein
MQRSSRPWVMCKMMILTFYNVLQWCAQRGEGYSDDEPRIGTSIKARLHLDGRVRWKKERDLAHWRLH